MQPRKGGYQGEKQSGTVSLPMVPTRQNKSCRVEPDFGDFNDVECGVTYVVPFMIHNSSNKMKRVRFIPPRSGPFRLNHMPQNIAPGLSQIVEVEFSTNVEKEYEDQWSLVTDDCQIAIPLHAWFPCPNFQFDNLVSLGTTPVQQNVSKHVTIKNVGKRNGKFKFVYDQGVGMSITPKNGNIEPGGKLDVRVDYFGQEQGSFEARVDIEIDGQPTRNLTVKCKVVESRVDLLSISGGNSVSALAFGTCYFGQVRNEKLRLVNKSPFVVSWHVQAPDDGDNMGGEEDDGDELNPMSCTPGEGRLGANSSCILDFSFFPTYKERRKGFARTAKKPSELAADFKSTFVVDIMETEQKVELGVTGRAIQPDVSFSDTVFRFGECDVNDYRDILLTISNNSSELPVELHINRVAHFHVSPSKGVLAPMKEMDLIVTYQPKQLGKFSNNLMCTLSGVKQMPLMVQGISSAVSASKPIGGIDKVGEDFKHKPKLMQSLGANERQKVTKKQASGAADLPGQGVNADGTLVPQPPNRKMQHMQDRWEHGGQTVEDTLYLTEFEQKRQHNSLYNEYIENMKASSKLIQRLRLGDGYDLKAVDLGMVPCEGLKSPEPRVPRKQEPLWLDGSTGDEKGEGQLRPKKRHKFDENRPIKKKFKPSPTTLNEQRECKMVLSPKDVAEVVIGPKVLDFGKVTVGSRNTKSFFVSNDLKTNIQIMVPTNIRDELKDSSPMSQVVPPGATAGFDIVFQSSSVQTFQQAIFFTLNDHHKLKFVVFAEVVPKDLGLSVDEMLFRFNEFVLDSTLTQPITITNHGNAEAKFEWLEDGPIMPGNKPFTIEPLTGSIPALGSATANITYDPGSVIESVVTMRLKVEGGPERKLVCLGSVTEARCVIADKKVDVGALPVGCCKYKSIAMKNTGQHTAVFNIDSLVEGITCNPMRGRVAPGQSQELQLCFRPMEATTLSTNLVVNVRGGKTIKLPLRAEARVPSVVFSDSEPQIKFEDCFVGSSSYKMLTLINQSSIPAILAVDLSEQPDFVLADADKHNVTQHAQAIDEDFNPAAGIVITADDEDEESDGSDDDSEADQSQALSGSGLTPRGPKGIQYRITVPAEKSLTFHLLFKPTVVDSYSFPFKLSLAGMETGANDELNRMVVAKSLKPRLVLSQTIVDFATKVVIRDGTSKVPNRVLLKLSNEDDQDLEWELAMDPDHRDREIWRLEPNCGMLKPGHATQVQVTFTPHAVKPYEIKLPVYLGKSHASKYTELILRGIGSNPNILFDRQEVVLPIVPLDVPSKATFWITNEGYEALDVRYKVPFHETGKIPLTLAFPEGQKLTQTTTTLPVEITFLSKKPLSFTANLDFFDEEGSKFTVAVTGCADNCLLTTYDYLFNKRGKGYSLEYEAENKPIMLIDKEVTGDAGSSQATEPTTPRSYGHGFSSAMSTATLGGEDTPDSIRDRQLRKIYNKKFAERMRVWLNMNVLQDPLDDLVTGMAAAAGRALCEVIESLFGRPPPGRVNPDKLPPNKKDAAVQMLNAYEDIITFIKSYGGLLAGVRAEYLLRYEDYQRIDSSMLLGAPTPSGGGPAGTSAASAISVSTSVKSGKRLSERRWGFRAAHAWMTVVYQVIRIFALSKISWKNFTAQPMTDIMRKVAEAEDWAKIKVDPSIVGSNIFSIGESILLKWLTIHKQAIYPPTEEDLQLSKGKVETRVMDFGPSLVDGKAFAAVLQAYAPPLTRRFNPNLEGGFILSPIDSVDHEHNLEIVLNAMKELGIVLPFSPKEILEFSQRDMVLFVTNMYFQLPTFIPKTTVKFRGHLHQPITKTIELKNPTRFTIDYDAQFFGSEEFKIVGGDTSIKIDAQSSVQVVVSITPRFKKPVSSRLTFLAQRVGSLSASMVFNLHTDVTYEGTAKVIDVETSLYEPLNYELEVENPFNAHAQFHLTYTQERVNTGENFPEEASAHMFPEAFWTSTDMLNVKRLEKTKMLLQFLPFVRGSYQALLVFSDEKVGEFAVQFNGRAHATLPFEKVNVQTEANSHLMRDVPFPLKNTALERGLNFVAERFKQFKSKDKKKQSTAGLEEGCKYAVQYNSPFWIGPKELEHGKPAVIKDKKVLDRIKPPEDEEEAEKPEKKPSRKEVKGRKDGTIFQLLFSPKGPGLYPSKLVFASDYDVRTLEVEGRSRAPGMKAELEFICPARQQITQDIPITNKSEKDWVISSALIGENFSAPREVRVPAGRTKNFPLIFSPSWMCDVKGTLTLKNNETLEKYIYTLNGRGEEPLAENHINVECRARETMKVKLSVPNIGHDDTEYTVESDVPFLAGEGTILVPRMETLKYEVTLSPALGGKYTGSVTFTSPSGNYLWYVISVNVGRPPPESEVAIESEMRKAVVAEVAIGNPTGEEVIFDVHTKGDGLIGEDAIQLDPFETKNYELVFAPLTAGRWEGSLSFYSEEVGEYWYSLMLEATEPQPVVLEPIQCDLGKSKQVKVLIQNPIDQELSLIVQNSNEVNFMVNPSPLLLKPFADAYPTITYQPSSIGVKQPAKITFVSTKVGNWNFELEGYGHPPTPMPQLTIEAGVNRSTNTSITFRNPFPVLKRFMVKLASDGDEFALMVKKPTHSVPAFGALQIPLGYSPKLIAEHRAVLTVQLLGEDEALTWEHPILGIAEASSMKTGFRVFCQARKEIVQIIAVKLDQLDSNVDQESFTYEVAIPKNSTYKTSIERSLQVERVEFSDYTAYMQKELDANPSAPPIDTELQHNSLFFRTTFVPLRPFKETVELVVRKSTGGMWRYDLGLEALAPDCDDVIEIEAPLGKTESVSFHLMNIFPSNDPFTASFTPDTPSEFTVMPTKGILMGTTPSGSKQSLKASADADAKGTQFVVSYTSTSYGKALQGFLCIDTQEMHWRYDLRGSLPKYITPAGSTKVDRQLAPDTRERLRLAREERQRRNFMKENQAFVEQVSSLNKQIKSDVALKPPKIRPAVTPVAPAGRRGAPSPSPR
mmetsp:Transcript_140642/g.244902  ORF Transcript_140642/g.244902 Transcript_140642/m.244902 type:complete len:2974 (-) Transcript_140642:636-9557(-)